MSRLTRRGPAPDQLYTAADADAFMDRASGSHTVRWSASAYRWLGPGGAEELLYENIPITGGTLTLDSSDPSRRQLSMEVGGGDALVPATSEDPLAPFGQFIKVWVTIDRPDGTWFPPIMMGLFPIQSYVYERPSLIATVEGQDLSARVNEYLHLQAKSYNKMKVSAAIIAIVQAALPNALVDDTHTVASAKTEAVGKITGAAASGRWDTAVEIAAKYGYDTYFDGFGRLIIQTTLTGGESGIVGEGGTAPDIGSVAEPIAFVAEGAGGNLVALTVTTTREGAANYVRFNLHGTVTVRGKGKKKKKQGRAYLAEAEQTTGPAAFGDRFGFLPIVQDAQLGTVTAGEVATWGTRAKNTLYRRVGVVRYLDLDAMGLYWVEPDDRVNLRYGTRDENHFVQAVTFDLAGQAPTRLRTRSLSAVELDG